MTQELITSDTLKKWNACRKYYICFCQLFPKGTDFETAAYGLIADNNIALALWLIDKSAENNFCDVKELLNKLAYYDDEWVRYNTARNLNTPPEALNKLAGDANDFIRMWTASNPNTPLEALEKLVCDADDFVRLNAKENLKKGI